MVSTSRPPIQNDIGIAAFVIIWGDRHGHGVVVHHSWSLFDAMLVPSKKVVTLTYILHGNEIV